MSSMAMKELFVVLTALFSPLAVHTHRASHGLVCTNDFRNSVSCSWNSSAVDPSGNCSISGVKRVAQKFITQSCQVKHLENSLPGCRFEFKNYIFSSFEVMPNISVKCHGTLVETVHEYHLNRHIKMHPPSAPHVRDAGNETWISWSPGPNVSIFLKFNFEFQVQLKRKTQSWEKANVLYANQRDRMVLDETLRGHMELRVRVKPLESPSLSLSSQWSEWSPTTSWIGPPNKQESPENEERWLFEAVLSVGVLLPLCLIISAVVVIYKHCKTRGFLREKPIPNPSEYFSTLHSVHGGNLKDWLNPLSLSDSFFTSQPCEQISPVVLDENCDAVPSLYPSSEVTTALLHFCHHPSAGSQASGVLDTSSSSSCFSNMGYFMSDSSSRGTAHKSSTLAYFTYQDDPCALQPFSWRAYESLKKPHSPDSGFCIGQEDELDIEDIDLDGKNHLDDLSSHLLTIPLHLPLHIVPVASPPPPPPHHLLGVVQASSDVQQVDVVPAEAASGGSAAQIAPGTMCRSSSMPVEQSRTGYLTLKDLQMTFSNKSI